MGSSPLVLLPPSLKGRGPGGARLRRPRPPHRPPQPPHPPPPQPPPHPPPPPQLEPPQLPLVPEAVVSVDFTSAIRPSGSTLRPYSPTAITRSSAARSSRRRAGTYRSAALSC